VDSAALLSREIADFNLKEETGRADSVSLETWKVMI
jgi:hypothetical protein